MTAQVLYTVDGAIATITLNRPEALNALNNSMIAAIRDGIRHAAADTNVRVLVLAGEGKSFCAGDDLIDMGTPEHPKSDDLMEEYLRGYPVLVEELRRIEKPTICRVQRHALGAGFEMALACDFVIADEPAKVGLPFALRGIAAGTALLPALVPRQVVARVLYTAELIGVSEAQGWGVITRVVPASKLDEAVATLADQLSGSATRAIGLMKGAIAATEEAGLSGALRMQAAATVSSALTSDFREGAVAFEEKRAPEFT
uniref:enoyl-CoA hydratase/isomerase family protein n=1 Tax=Leucobacter sp. BZR 635 TaxID=3378705 RepID=UPI003A8B40E7